MNAQIEYRTARIIALSGTAQSDRVVARIECDLDILKTRPGDLLTLAFPKETS